MSKMYLVKPDGIDAEWNATNYGENEYTQLSMKMIMSTEKSSETYGIFQELLFRLGWRANDTDICPMNMEQCHESLQEVSSFVKKRRGLLEKDMA